MQNMTRPNRPDLDATKTPTEIDVAWSAGIYEGEGHCRLCGKTKRGLSAAVVQKDPELLYRLRDWFGGRVGVHNAKQGTHVWECNGDRCRLFLALIYGFMTARRRQQIDATNGLEFLRGRSPVNLTLMQLKKEMDIFYSEHTERVRLRKKEAAKRAHVRRYSDPEVRARTHAVQKQYREKLKQDQLHLVIEKTA